MNPEGYHDPTAEQAIGRVDKKVSAMRPVFEGWVPPDAWKFTKPYLLSMSMTGYKTIIIVEDDNGFKHRIKCRR